MKTMTVTVDDPQKFGSSISPYITYRVRVQPQNIATRKRFSEFEILWRQLTEIIGKRRIKIPDEPFVSKRYFGRFNPERIEERRVKLQEFMDFIVREPFLRKQPTFIRFINVTPISVWELDYAATEEDRPAPLLDHLSSYSYSYSNSNSYDYTTSNNNDIINSGSDDKDLQVSQRRLSTASSLSVVTTDDDDDDYNNNNNSERRGVIHTEYWNTAFQRQNRHISDTANSYDARSVSTDYRDERDFDDDIESEAEELEETTKSLNEISIADIPIATPAKTTKPSTPKPRTITKSSSTSALRSPTSTTTPITTRGPTWQARAPIKKIAATPHHDTRRRGGARNIFLQAQAVDAVGSMTSVSTADLLSYLGHSPDSDNGAEKFFYVEFARMHESLYRDQLRVDEAHCPISDNEKMQLKAFWEQDMQLRPVHFTNTPMRGATQITTNTTEPDTQLADTTTVPTPTLSIVVSPGHQSKLATTAAAESEVTTSPQHQLLSDEDESDCDHFADCEGEEEEVGTDDGGDSDDSSDCITDDEDRLYLSILSLRAGTS